jgi:hypothetical protein
MMPCQASEKRFFDDFISVQVFKVKKDIPGKNKKGRQNHMNIN